MRTMLRVISSELIKLKRSLLLKVSVLIPAGFIIFEFIGALQRNTLGISPGVNFWSAITESISRTWFFLLSPLLFTLQTALIGELERVNDTWKVINSQPVGRFLVIVVKQIIAFIVACISLIVLLISLILVGLALKHLKPEFNVDAYIPIVEMARFLFIPTAISSLIIAFQTWVALNWGNFIVTSAVGITSTLIALFLFEHEYSMYFIWDFPGMGLYRLIEGKPVTDLLLLSLLLALLISLVANILLSRKESAK